MKKKFIKTVFLFFLSFMLFFSCDRHLESSDSVDDTQTEFKDFLYIYTYNSLKHVNDQKYFLPDYILTELNRFVLDDGVPRTVFELLFPDKFDLTDFSNVYDCHSDNGLWIDNLMTVLEEERMGNEIDEMLNLMNSGELTEDEEKKSLDAKNKIEEIIINEITDYNDDLSLLEYGKEIFIPQKRNGQIILIHAFDKKATRFFYDNLYRCIREENWEIDGKGNEELKKLTEKTFHNDTYKTAIKKITVGDSIIEQSYNEKGLLVNEFDYVFIKEKKVIKKSINFKYDKQERVTEINKNEYNYLDDDKEQLSYIFNKKYIYKFKSDNNVKRDGADSNSPDDIPPDFDYYEDGVLRISNRYKSSDSYTNEVFFDEGRSVIAYYEKGKLIKEVFSINSNTERIKYHE